jgi:ribosomal protein S18 acetylase RimI-like enzyme
MDLVCVTIDCADPAAVATFWSDALGWSQPQVHADGLGAVCRPPFGAAYLEFIRVPEGKLVKNRVHLGCSAGRLDQLDDELTRLQALGATIAWEEEFPPDVAAVYRNVVLRDVEGNEFCLGAGTMAVPHPREEIGVRAAAAPDRDRILALAAELSDTTFPWRDRLAVEAAVRASITSLLDNPSSDHTVLVATAHDAVVGFITVSCRPHFTGAVDASIDDLVVAGPNHQRGVARGLLEAAEQWARRRGLERVTVETGAANQRAIRLYRSAGYQEEDLRLTKHLDR